MDSRSCVTLGNGFTSLSQPFSCRMGTVITPPWKEIPSLLTCSLQGVETKARCLQLTTVSADACQGLVCRGAGVRGEGWIRSVASSADGTI